MASSHLHVYSTHPHSISVIKQRYCPLTSVSLIVVIFFSAFDVYVFCMAFVDDRYSGTKFNFPCWMRPVAVKFIQFPLSSVLSSIPILLTNWCSRFHLLTTMQKGGDERTLTSRWVFSLFIQLTWQNVCRWKADACTEVMYSSCLVDYLHLCDTFTGNCTCFNVNHVKGSRSPCETLTDANVEDPVDSIFVSCVVALNFVSSLSLHWD